ncbi:FMRFamide receptor-like [Lingula anatina]|uniref:FMRFamide receptor-like n=1 Tax=Lingula anatina TaxID=7574 RepID=A0A2R2MQ95_LINAN|nr:FMRFamide receptor-like [Lingula anatina]|eukprot:XP_023932419.1 FMRFamide receptor-like [Lingula anatina]
MHERMDALNCTGSNLSQIAGEDPDFLLYQFVVNAYITAPLCLLGLLGNTLAFFTLMRDTKRSVTFFLLRAMAVMDNLVLIIALLLVLPTVHPNTGLLKCFSEIGYIMDTWIWPLGMTFQTAAVWLVVVVTVDRYIAVKMPHRVRNNEIGYIMDTWIWPLGMTFQTAAVWLVVVVTVDRYIAVKMPHRVRSLSTISKAKIATATVSLISVLFNLPRFFEFYISYDLTCVDNTTTTTLKPVSVPTALQEDQDYHYVYTFALYCLVNFVIPLATLIFLNINLILVVHRANTDRRIMSVQSLRAASRNQASSETNITFMLILVVCVFIVCQLPALVTQIWYAVDPEQTGYKYLGELSNLMVTCNSAVNFLIYCAFGKRFRELLRETFCGRHSRRKGRSSFHRSSDRYTESILLKDT